MERAVCDGASIDPEKTASQSCWLIGMHRHEHQ